MRLATHRHDLRSKRYEAKPGLKPAQRREGSRQEDDETQSDVVQPRVPEQPAGFPRPKEDRVIVEGAQGDRATRERVERVVLEDDELALGVELLDGDSKHGFALGRIDVMQDA
jgi:hypothetical protein